MPSQEEIYTRVSATLVEALKAIFQRDEEFVQDGRVTEKGLEKLRARMPFADLSEFEQNPEVSAIGDLFAVDMIARYIQGKLNQPCNA